MIEALDRNVGRISRGLERLIAHFAEICPDTVVRHEFLAESNIQSRLAEAAGNGSVPALLLTSHTQLDALNAANLLQDMTPFVDDGVFLRYHFRALSALHIEETLYGLPLDCRVAALFYRPDLVDDVSRQRIDSTIAF